MPNVLPYLLMMVAMPYDAAQALASVRPVLGPGYLADRQAACATPDRSTWVVWYQSRGRAVGWHEPGQEQLDPAEGLFCALVDSLGHEVLAPRCLARPRSLRAAECWGGDPLLVEALTSPAGDLVVITVERSASGYVYCGDTQSPNMVGPRGPVTERTRVLAVRRSGVAREVSLPTAVTHFAPEEVAKPLWYFWGGSGVLHLLALSRVREQGSSSVVHAVIAASADTVSVVSLDSTPERDTTSPAVWRAAPGFGWIGKHGERSAVAEVGADTLLVATLEPADMEGQRATAVDSLRIVRVQGHPLKLVDRQVRPASSVAGRDYDRAGPRRAVLVKTDSGLVFFCNTQDRLASYYLDGRGNPISASRTTGVIGEGRAGQKLLRAVVELAQVGLTRTDVTWYEFAVNGDVSRSTASSQRQPGRKPWEPSK